MTNLRPLWSRMVLAVATLCVVTPAAAQTTVGAVTTTEGDVRIPLMGFGLVVGLDGTGDRNLSASGRSSGTSARAIANLLELFGIPVDDDILRVRNVAAVIVQAEVDPFLRAGQEFDIRVSSLHDATSLAGGELLMTPLLMHPADTLVPAVGQGRVIVQQDPAGRILRRGAASGRIPSGGLIEVDLPRPQVSTSPILSLNDPDVTMAVRIADVINAALGDGTATAIDKGTVQLNPPAGSADNPIEFLASIDTLEVFTHVTPKIIIDSRDGTVAVVGNIMLGQTTTVTHNGITLTIGADPNAPPVAGVVMMPVPVPVQDIAAGLHAAGASPQEMAVMFEQLKKAGVIAAEIEIQ